MDVGMNNLFLSLQIVFFFCSKLPSGMADYSYHLTLGFNCICIASEDYPHPYAVLTLKNAKGMTLSLGETEGKEKSGITGEWEKHFFFEANPDNTVVVQVWDQETGAQGEEGHAHFLGRVEIPLYAGANGYISAFPMNPSVDELKVCGGKVPPSTTKSRIHCRNKFKPELVANLSRLKS